MSRKAIALILAGLIAISSLAAMPVIAADLDLKAESAILLDAQSGKIIYEKDAHKILFPASMTKLMTLVLAMEALKTGKVQMSDIVTASETAASYKGSRIFLTRGERLTMYELILGVALASGNDASVAVAEHIAGSHEQFVEMMNTKASQLGMKNTHFVNCNGLHDPNHYTTAYDFSLLALEALCYPELLKITSTKHYQIREDSRPFQYDNKNKLLWWYNGADGFKTGWTDDAKYCFVGTVERENLRFVSVVMGVKEPNGHFRDTMVLYNWGFSRFSFKQFYAANEALADIRVGKGQKNQIKAVTENKVGTIVERGEEKKLTSQIDLPESADAPIIKGQILGTVTIIKDGNVLEKSNIIADEAVGKDRLISEFIKILQSTVLGNP